MTISASEFIPDLVNNMIQKDIKRLKDLRTNLIEENAKLGNPTQGFLFHGEYVSDLPRNQLAHAPKKLLAKELHKQGRDYFKQKDLLVKETRRMIQALVVVVKEAKTKQDMRDMLPDVCIPFAPSEISVLPRTRPEGFMYSDKPLKKHEFDHTVEILTFYNANNILY